MLRLTTTQRQTQIIETSLEIIKQGGIQKLTVKEIATRIGISEQAIYRHFTSKLEILTSIIRYFNTNLKNHLDPNFFKGSATDKITALTDAHLDYLQTHPAVAAVIFSEEIFQNESSLAQAVKNALQERLNTMALLIREGQESGEFKNDFAADELAYLFLGGLRLTVVHWRLSGFAFNVKEKGKKHVANLISLLQNYGDLTQNP